MVFYACKITSQVFIIQIHHLYILLNKISGWVIDWSNRRWEINLQVILMKTNFICIFYFIAMINTQLVVVESISSRGNFVIEATANCSTSSRIVQYVQRIIWPLEFSYILIGVAFVAMFSSISYFRKTNASEKRRGF